MSTKQLDAKKIREMSAEDVGKELLELRRAQLNLRVLSASGQGVRAHEVRRIRKDIARLKTVMRERQLTEQGENA